MRRPITLSQAQLRAALRGELTWLCQPAVVGSVGALDPATPEGSVAPMGGWSYVRKRDDPRRYLYAVYSPFGAAGDALYVRERWALHADSGHVLHTPVPGEPVWYRADPAEPAIGRGRWRSRRSMPLWAARVVLRVDRLRLGRLHAAMVERGFDGIGLPFLPVDGAGGSLWRTFQASAAWDSWHGAGPFAWWLNPLCWIADVTRIEIGGQVA